MIIGNFGFTEVNTIGDNCAADNSPIVPGNVDITPSPEGAKAKGNNGKGNSNVEESGARR